MGAILATVGMGLLALFVGGLIFTLVVKLTVSVGKYISEKVKEQKKRTSASRMKELIAAMKREYQNEMVHELGEEAVALWSEDDNGNVLEETIELIKGDQVDEKTKRIMDRYNGFVTIAPSAVC